MSLEKQELQANLYAWSPFDLGSDSDNKYRDMVDFILNPKQCAHCGDIMSCVIRAHHHTENGVDVTEKK